MAEHKTVWVHDSAYLKKATRDSERSSNVVRDEAKIWRRTAGVTGKRERDAVFGPLLVTGGVPLEDDEDEGGMQWHDERQESKKQAHPSPHLPASCFHELDLSQHNT
jgi:hypothetical protein